MTGNKRREVRRVLAFLTLIGVAVVAGGFFLIGSASRFVAVAENADGRVVRIEESTHRENVDDGRTYEWIAFHPVIAFEDRTGKVVEFVAPGRKHAPEFEVGATVPVLFDPAASDDARIDRFSSVWGAGLMALAAGLAWLAITFGFYRLFRSPDPANDADSTERPMTMPIEQRRKAWSTGYVLQPAVIRSASFSKTISLKGAFLPGAFSDPRRRLEVILVWFILPFVPVAFAGIFVAVGLWYVTPVTLPAFIGMFQGYRRHWKLARQQDAPAR